MMKKNAIDESINIKSCVKVASTIRSITNIRACTANVVYLKILLFKSMDNACSMQITPMQMPITIQLFKI